MDKIECDFNQFDVPHGHFSCTSTAFLCARFFLEVQPTKDDLHRILHAGGKVWNQWYMNQQQEVGIRHNFQYWKDVVRTFPGIMNDVKVVYETNGVVGQELDDSSKNFLLTTLEDALEHVRTSDTPKSSVLTIDNASYAINANNQYIYFFDSHGKSNLFGAGDGAYYIRVRNHADMVDYLNDFLGHCYGSEFTLVVFEFEGTTS